MRDDTSVQEPGLQITILWGDTVLHVQHLARGQSFWLSDGTARELTSQYVVPSEVLGSGPIRLVRAREGFEVQVPQGASATLYRGAEHCRLAAGEAGSPAMTRIEPGDRLELRAGPLLFVLEADAFDKQCGAALRKGRAWKHTLYTAG